jgi:RNA polymerase sigma-70 factor (ECF subfamily)
MPGAASPEPSKQGRFPTTRWSLIVSSRQWPTPDSREALASLCTAYWYPLYAFVRRRGQSVEDAQDLTQGFFSRLLDKRYLDDFDRERGRFRTFLMAAFRHYIINECNRERAQKRGGELPTLPLDLQNAEWRYHLEPSHSLTPEKIYERCWTLALLERSMERLRAESADQTRFDRVQGFLTSEPGDSYRHVAEELNMSEGALKVAVHRLRRRYGDLLREEIAQTVASREEIKDELTYLLSAVSL